MKASSLDLKRLFCYNLASDQFHIVMETPHLLQDKAEIIKQPLQHMQRCSNADIMT